VNNDKIQSLKTPHKTSGQYDTPPVGYWKWTTITKSVHSIYPSLVHQEQLYFTNDL